MFITKILRGLSIKAARFPTIPTALAPFDMALLNETRQRREVAVAVSCAVTVAAAVTFFASS
jgi:hypothetical protein